MINTKTKGELGRRIEYDVEHDLFHPQNIYSDEYITPTFVEYVQKLEKEIKRLETELAITDHDREHNYYECLDLYKKVAELEAEVTRLKNENLDIINKYTRFAETDRRTIAELEKKLTEKVTLESLDVVSSKISELEKENAELKKEVEKHKWNNIFLEDCADYDKKIAEEYTTLQERIATLEQENAELKEKLNFSTQYYQGEKAKKQLTKAREIILRLYNAGRDVLMCRAEEKAYDNLSNAIDDKSIEQFLSEVEK